MAKRPAKSKKKTKKQTESEAKAKAARSKQFERATGTTSEKLQEQIFDQLVKSLWLPSGLSEKNKKDRIFAAYSALQGIKPGDEIEGMLGTQMVSTHNAAMECLSRAMLEDQPFQGRDLNLKHGVKLLTLYARQMEALDKRRGKGQQTVTVKHVHVEAGGQAIVGQVNTDKSPQAEQEPGSSSTKALAHNPGDIIDMEPEKAAKPRKAKPKTRKVPR